MIEQLLLHFLGIALKCIEFREVLTVKLLLLFFDLLFEFYPKPDLERILLFHVCKV